jgi:hypothetical protein
MGQRKGSFQELLTTKYSKDLSPLDQFYGDTFGNKFSDELIEELLSDNPENPEEFISGKINETKGKYGKYLGAIPPSSPDVPTTGPEGKSDETEPEELAKGTDGEPSKDGEALTESAEPIEEKKSKSRKRDYTPDMMKTLGLKFTSKV